jgi:Ca2+-binding EF-hand superfamily protein
LTGYLIEKDISLAKVTEWFRALDNAKDGTMRLYGLQHLLEKLEINLSRLEVYSIFKNLA